MAASLQVIKLKEDILDGSVAIVNKCQLPPIIFLDARGSLSLDIK
jgi:hypothetical protein